MVRNQQKESNNKSNTLLCGICNVNPSKYKCPKCMIPYCSLLCFKDETHVVNHKESLSIDSTASHDNNGIIPQIGIDDKTTDSQVPSNIKFDQIINDPIIRSMLQEKSLQFHLLTLIKVMKSPQELKLNNEIVNNRDNRLSIMNSKLNDLRIGGLEENLMIEEFIHRVLTIYNQES
ncbi:protein required for growth at high temperature [Scheffersomyces coipomensis]|uniref:protein required for growth at high temperature n=1 Tax=Scheffersomyces coipomensis TaxID=1788519 RepID=UPI00315C9B1E